MLNDENPLKTITQDAVAGAVSGLGLGVLGSNIKKVVRGKQLKSFGDIDQLDNIARKQYQKFKDGSRRYYMTRNTSSGTPHATSTGSKGSVSNSIISENSQTLKPFTEWLEELKRNHRHK